MTDLGNDAFVFLLLYLIGMLGIGWLGRTQRRDDSLRDFYLGGSTLGFVVLFLTFFATQYSGNTVLGFAGRAYQRGAAHVESITMMVLVVSVFMVYAPRLFRLSRRFGYVTPADFVFHRFGSHGLRVLTVGLLCWGLGNYILEQLVAMGRGAEALSGGRLTALAVHGCRTIGLGALVADVSPGELDFMLGVVGLAAVMLIYESLGGMRAVAWTDVVQGVLLLSGCACILHLIMTTSGGLSQVAERIAVLSPEKLAVPDAAGLRTWVSHLLLLGFGVAVYPHAVQRIFAARSLSVLRRALSWMAFMPLVTTLLAFLLGYVGLARFPGLAPDESDKITIYVLSGIGDGAFEHWVVVVTLTAVVAAIMSTADSALLTLGSMFTKDIYKVYVRPDASPRHCLVVGKTFAWGLMLFLIVGAYASLRTESSIWLLIKLKLEFMVQIAPVFVLGVFWRRLPAWAALAGMSLGTAFTLLVWGGAMFDLWATRSPWNISAGVWGLALNVCVCALGARVWPTRTGRAA